MHWNFLAGIFPAKTNGNDANPMKRIILNLKEIGVCFDLGFFSQAMKLILPKRIDGMTYTLEKIGFELGITRERVRQKTMKIRNLLRTNRLAKDTYDLVIASFLKLFGADAIVALETVRQKFAYYPLLADILMLIVSSFSPDDDTEDLLPGIFYIGRSGFIQMNPYNGYSQDLLKRRAEEMKPDYSMDEIQVLRENERIFLTHSGKLRSMGEGYLRNGTNEGNLILNLIEHGFPNGYRIYNSDDYSRFAALRRDCYDDRELPSQNTVRGLVGRKWANVDKGTYLPRNDSLSIPDDLLGEM